MSGTEAGHGKKLRRKTQPLKLENGIKTMYGKYQSETELFTSVFDDVRPYALPNIIDRMFISKVKEKVGQLDMSFLLDDRGEDIFKQ